MIIQFLLDFIVIALNTLTSWVPSIDTLPTILGINVDYELEFYVSMIYRVKDSFWLLQDLFTATLVVLGYMTTKVVLRFFLGSRYG